MLTIGKVTNLITIIVNNYYNNSNRLLKRVRTERCYSYCNKVRYNLRTYKVDIEDADNSATSN
jgi:hypothetical protein